MTVAANASTATTSAPLGPGNSRSVRVANKSSGWAHIQAGQGTVQAATVANDLCVGPGAVEIFTFSTSNIFSVILDSGTGNVIFTRGEGV